MVAEWAALTKCGNLSLRLVPNCRLFILSNDSRQEASFNPATRAKVYAAAGWLAWFAGPKDLRSLL